MSKKKNQNAKNNMKQAMYEMFGVGEDMTASGLEEENVSAEFAEISPDAVCAAECTEEATIVKLTKREKSYIAAGTTFEGTIKTEGDLEISGDFKGDISSDGEVIIHSDVESNVVAKALKISGSVLKGEVKVEGSVVIEANSKILGNVTASELMCAGEITGNLTVSGSTVLENTAKVSGQISTGTITVMKGAVIKGGIEING